MTPLSLSGTYNFALSESLYGTLGGAPEWLSRGPVGAAVSAVDRLKVVVGVRIFGLADFNRSAVQYVSVSTASARGAERD
jgi:hypothetical protein